MYRKITLGLALVGLILAASGLAEAGRGPAMSPVGAWTVQFRDDAGPEGDNTLLEQFHFGGTISGAAWTDSTTNTVGSWTKARQNRYLATIYVMIPALEAYVKVVREFWMVGKDEMKGREEGWWVSGRDPLGPAAGPIWTGDLSFVRIPAEPKQVP